MSAAPPIIQELRDQIARHQKLLKTIEWAGCNCPACGGLFRSGHKADCELRALLGRVTTDTAPAASEETHD